MSSKNSQLCQWLKETKIFPIKASAHQNTSKNTHTKLYSYQTNPNKKLDSSYSTYAHSFNHPKKNTSVIYSKNNNDGQFRCSGCMKVIKERFLLKALDRLWHEDCLKCSCCDCRLGEVGSSLFSKANLLLCRRDYLRLFGTTGYCSVCDKMIPAFEMVMRARHNVYHLECFACQQCSHRFCVGDRYYLYDNKILCEYDYEEKVILARASFEYANQYNNSPVIYNNNIPFNSSHISFPSNNFIDQLPYFQDENNNVLNNSSSAYYNPNGCFHYHTTSPDSFNNVMHQNLQENDRNIRNFSITRCRGLTYRNLSIKNKCEKFVDNKIQKLPLSIPGIKPPSTTSEANKLTTTPNKKINNSSKNTRAISEA